MIRRFYYFLVLFLALGVVGPSIAISGELYEFYQGARARAMGNAFTAVADDEQAVFMNPAGLAGNKEYRFHYLTADLATSSDVVYSVYGGATSSLTGLSGKEGGDLSDLVMGKNIYGRSQLTSMVTTPYFGLAAIVDGQLQVSSQNKALPRILLGYQTTNGIQGSFGFPVAKLFRRKAELRLGLGFKTLWRRGGYRVLKTIDTVNMDRGKLSQITGPFGFGFGADLGSQYVHQFTKRLSFKLGTVYTDLGDTNFGAQPMAIKGNLSSGVAGTYDYGRSSLTLAYDFRHINEQTDWRKKNHLGLEVSVPFLRLYGGVNQVYFTYGATIDLGIVKITGLSYAEEHGSFAFQNGERRWVLSTALSFSM